MNNQETVAIVGSKTFNNIRKVRRVIAELASGTRVLTGDMGKVNLLVQELVRARGDLELVVISADKEGGEVYANRKTIKMCTRAVIFCANQDSRASFVATFAATMGKPYQKIMDDAA